MASRLLRPFSAARARSRVRRFHQVSCGSCVGRHLPAPYPSSKMDQRSRTRKQARQSFVRARQISILDQLSASPAGHDDISSPEGKEEQLNRLILAETTIGGSPSLRANSGLYLAVLRAWAQSRKAVAPFKAEEWICRLEREYEAADKDASLLPSVHHYNAVIEAWALSRESNAPLRAERWLNKLKSGSITPMPSTESYKYYLNACSKGHGKSIKNMHANAMKAELTLKEMIELSDNVQDCNIVPDTDCFNYVIRAWTRCRSDTDIAEKVMDILRTMELYQRTSFSGDQSVTSVSPNTLSYSMAIDAWSVVAGLKVQRSLKAQRRKRWERNSSPSRLDEQLRIEDGMVEIEKASQILQYMHDLQDAGDVNVVPNTASYNTLISAFVRTANVENRDHPLEAERILLKMIDFRNQGNADIAPDQRSFIHVMRSWSKTQRSNSAERAEWWLGKMWEEYRETGNSNLRPNIGVYNAVMEAYFRRMQLPSLTSQKNVRKLDQLLMELLKFERNGDETLHANTASFTFAIRGWLKHEIDCCDGKELGSGCARALYWLDELIAREEKGLPHATTAPELFEGILRSAHKASKRSNPTRVSKSLFKTSLECFTELRASRFKMTPTAYVCVLEIGLKTLSSPADNSARSRFVRHLAKACKEDGFVSDRFVSSLSNGRVWAEGWTAKNSLELTKELFADCWPFPKTWSRNLNSRRSGELPTKKSLRRSRTLQVQVGEGHDSSRAKAAAHQSGDVP